MHGAHIATRKNSGAPENRAGRGVGLVVAIVTVTILVVDPARIQCHQHAVTHAVCGDVWAFSLLCVQDRAIGSVVPLRRSPFKNVLLLDGCLGRMWRTLHYHSRTVVAAVLGAW